MPNGNLPRPLLRIIAILETRFGRQIAERIVNELIVELYAIQERMRQEINRGIAQQQRGLGQETHYRTVRQNLTVESGFENGPFRGPMYEHSPSQYSSFQFRNSCAYTHDGHLIEIRLENHTESSEHRTLGPHCHITIDGGEVETFPYQISEFHSIENTDRIQHHSTYGSTASGGYITMNRPEE